MVRRLLRLAFGAVGLALLVGLLFLAEAHWEIRGIRPPLPDRAAIEAVVSVGDTPSRIRYVLTAEQRSLGRRVGHPAFLIEWADGRTLLIDAGMEPEEAMAFGRPFEWLGGAPPVTYGSIADQLGPAADAVYGVAFTHLHVDHTGGLDSLCRATDYRFPILQAPLQAEHANYTTAGGKRDLSGALCGEEERLEFGPVYGLVGFPGVAAVSVGGHTPGSTVYFVVVGERRWVLAGDVAFSRADILDDVAKPAPYSYLVVPEDRERLREIGHWLAGLESDARYRIVVSHAQDELESSGMERYPAAGPTRRS